MHYGRVKPKKEKKGVFEWLANSFLFMGPFFIPASLLLLCLVFLVENGIGFISTIDYTFAGQMIAFGSNLHAFSTNFFTFLFNIDILHPAHFGFLLLLIFLGMGIRPSYIGQEKRHKVDMLYDLRNIKDNILHKPLYILLLILTSYLFFYISLLFRQNWYSVLFSIFGMLSIIAITSILISHIIILLIKTTDELPGIWRAIPYITMPVTYILMRLLFYFIPSNLTYSVSLIVTILVTILVTYLLLRRKTNKFKTKRDIKLLKRKKKKGDKDGPGRSAEK